MNQSFPTRKLLMRGQYSSDRKMKKSENNQFVKNIISDLQSPIQMKRKMIQSVDQNVNEEFEEGNSPQRKKIFKNDGTSMKISQEASQNAEKMLSINHKRFQIIEFEDALVLKILIHQNGEDIRSFCSKRRINYRIRRDKKPAFIEVFGTESREISEEDVGQFGSLINIYKDKVKRELKEKIIQCNKEEYNHIRKRLDCFIEILNHTETTFIDPEGNQGESNLDLNYNPELIKTYEINRKFILKLMKIQKPSLLGYSTIDLLIMNIEPDLIFTDPFGYELVQKNASIKDLVKKNIDRIEKEGLICDLSFPFESKNILLCIQTSKSEQKCIENLKTLMDSIDKQELSSKGFLNIGISLNSTCSKKYFIELLKYFNKIENEDTYLAFPSEIQIYIPEEKEVLVQSYLDSVIKNKVINPEKVRKGGFWNYALQYSGNANYYNRNMNFNNSNFATTPLDEVSSVNIEKAFLREEKKVFIATPSLYKAQKMEYKKGRKNENDNEELIEEVEVNFLKMIETFITSGIERPISQDPKKKSKWSYVDTISQEFIEFEIEIGKAFKCCVDSGQSTFNYQRNLLDFSLLSKIMKVDFSLSSMVDLNSGDVFAIKRVENQKYNYLVEELNPDSKMEFINLKEQQRAQITKKQKSDNNKMEEEKNLNNQQHLKFRGFENDIELFNSIHRRMIENKYTTHVIQAERKLGKSSIKYIEEIAKQNNIKINYDEKNQELALKGYKKSINKIRPQIIHGFKVKFDEFSLPSDWQAQDTNVEIFDCEKDTEYSQHIMALVKKSLPNAKIHQIQRIQNISLWKNFSFEKKKLEEKGDSTEKWLFYGSRKTEPSKIYKGNEEGFDFRVSGGGSYGRGAYFHDLASYSYQLGYQKGEKIQIFCAKVLIGKCYATAPNGQYTAPPYIPGSKSVRYDSIRSNGAKGSNKYVIFNNNKAYPYYLITLTSGQIPNQFYGGKVGRFYNQFQDIEEEEEFEEDEDEEEYESDQSEEEEEEENEEDQNFIDDEYEFEEF